MQSLVSFPQMQGSSYSLWSVCLCLLFCAGCGLTPAASRHDRLPPDRGQVGRSPEQSTFVTQVYPSADALPENLLKFYLHFSAPMSRGDSYRHIRLVQQNGAVVELPFLELDQELWDRRQKRLTLLLDPGRIKRGLKPHDEVGPILKPGQRYTLEIDAHWLDAKSVPLVRSFRKTFRVLEHDVQSPDPHRWRVTSPYADTREPLSVTFSEPLDHALLLRLLSVRDPGGEILDGEFRITSNETRCQFTPARPWEAGSYRLVVDTLLEDLAGNSIARPFEVDLQKAASSSPPPRRVDIPFSVPVDSS